MKLAPLRQRHRQRLVSVKIHAASALFVLATDERASRIVVDLRLAVFEAPALGRLIKMRGDFFPVGHLPRYSN